MLWLAVIALIYTYNIENTIKVITVYIKLFLLEHIDTCYFAIFYNTFNLIENAHVINHLATGDIQAVGLYGLE